MKKKKNYTHRSCLAFVRLSGNVIKVFLATKIVWGKDERGGRGDPRVRIINTQSSCEQWKCRAIINDATLRCTQAHKTFRDAWEWEERVKLMRRSENKSKDEYFILALKRLLFLFFFLFGEKNSRRKTYDRFCRFGKDTCKIASLFFPFFSSENRPSRFCCQYCFIML